MTGWDRGGGRGVPAAPMAVAEPAQSRWPGSSGRQRLCQGVASAPLRQ